MKIAASIFKTFFLSLCIIANTHLAFAQTASILPQGKTQFLDNNAKPLTSGTVDFYTGNVSSTTRKTTWQNSGETIANTNPVVLDAGGRAIIYGDGSYRMVVKDRLNNLIYDQLTSSSGSGGGSSPTATGDGDLVGTVKPWAGMTAPNQYVFTYGQEVSRTTFSVLLTAITSAQAVFCISGSPILTGLSDTTNFPIGAPVEVSCLAAGFSTILSKTSNSITLNANANVSTNVNATIFPWGNGNHTTTFNIPDYRGFAIVGNNNMGGTASSIMTTNYFGVNPNSTGAAGGNQFNDIVLAAPNLPTHTHTSSSLTDPGHVHGITSNSVIGTGGGANTFAGGGSSNIVSAVISSNFTGITISANTGTNASGTSTPYRLGIVQPSKTSNYIIKVTPDTNSASASGVTSLGGMTGDIACGSGLLCTGNIVSVTGSIITTDSVNYTAPFTSAVTETQTVKNAQIINAGDFGAKCDGVTDDTTKITNAIAATPIAATLVLPAGNCLISGSGTQIFTITNPINIVGVGASSNPGLGTTLLLAAGVPSTRDIFHITGVLNNHLRGYSFKNLRVSGGAGSGAQNIFNFDSNAGTTTGFAEVMLDNLVLEAAASAGGHSVYLNNGGGTNVNGGTFNFTIQNSYIAGGILCSFCGDTIRIINNILTGPNAAFDITQISGGGGFLVSGNNITAGGGSIFRAGISPVIENNIFESQTSLTEPNNSILDFIGGENNKIINNQIQAIVGTPFPVRINGLNTVIDGNRITTPFAYAHISNTASANGTVIGSGNLFIGGGANIADSGTNTIFSPLGKSTTSLAVLGNPVSGTAAPAVNISSSAINQVLRVDGTAANLGFGQVSLSGSPSGVTGVLPIANGGTNDTGTSWTTYTPTVSAQTGTCTTCAATGRYKQLGKTIWLEVDVTITTVGTAAGALFATLPFTSTTNNYAGSGYERAVTGKSGAAVILGGTNATNVNTRDATGTTFFASGNAVTVGITYELP